MCSSIDEYPQRRRDARLDFREEQANRGQCGAQLDISTLLVLLNKEGRGRASTNI